MSAESNTPRKRGCLFYGCLTLAVVVVVVGILGYVGYQFARKSLNQMVTKYTDTAPTSFETVQLSRAESNELQQRLAHFQKALDSQAEQHELVLSEREINALISQNPNLTNRLLVRLEGDRIKGEISFPLQDIGPIKLNGRYLNGLATFRVAIAAGQLIVGIDDVQVKGQPLPEPFLSELKKKNIGQEIARDPQVVNTVARLESIDVRDGKLVLRNKTKGN